MTRLDEHDVVGALVAGEPDLPALAALLQPDSLSARLGAPVGVRRLRYKPGTSVHAAVTVGDTWCLLAGYAPHGASKLAKQQAVAAKRGLEAIVDESDRWVLVPAHADRAFRRPAVVTVDEAGGTFSYNPRRRLVVHGTSPADGAWVAKIYGLGEQPVERELAAALQAVGVPTPAPLRAAHRTVRRHVRCTGHLADPVADGHLVASTLDVLTTADVPLTLREWTALDLTPAIDRALDLVSAVVPGVAATADVVRRALHDQLPTTATLPTVVVHGDFSADQVVVDGDVAWLLDLDACGRGPLGWDRATWLASQVAHDDTTPTALPGPSPHPTLVAAALAMRTPEPFSRQRDGWAELTRRTLEFAADLLDRAEATCSR